MSAGGAPRARGAALLGVAAALALPGWRAAPAPTPCAVPAGTAELAGRTLEYACGATRGAPLRGPARLLFGLRLDANGADASALEALPGVGPARAAALVAARVHAPFCRSADLEKVTGIGPSIRAGLEPWLDFGDAAACHARQSASNSAPHESGERGMQGAVR